jgi:hypothetical protein
MYCQSVSCMLGYLFVHTAGSRAHANRATEAAPLLLDFSEVLTIRRLWGAELQTVHIQDIRLTWSSPIVSDLLLPPLPPSLYILENDGKPAAEDHTRACELQLRYMVVAGIFCTYRRVVPSCYLIESDPTSLNEGNRLSYFVSSSFFLSFFVCTVS